MKAAGYIIYPEKLTVVDSFRIGCIGRMDGQVMRDVVAAVQGMLSARWESIARRRQNLPLKNVKSWPVKVGRIIGVISNLPAS